MCSFLHVPFCAICNSSIKLFKGIMVFAVESRQHDGKLCWIGWPNPNKWYSSFANSNPSKPHSISLLFDCFPQRLWIQSRIVIGVWRYWIFHESLGKYVASVLVDSGVWDALCNHGHLHISRDNSSAWTAHIYTAQFVSMHEQFTRDIPGHVVHERTRTRQELSFFTRDPKWQRTEWREENGYQLSNCHGVSHGGSRIKSTLVFVSTSLNIAVTNMLTKLILMSLVNILATAILRLFETWYRGLRKLQAIRSFIKTVVWTFSHNSQTGARKLHCVTILNNWVKVWFEKCM